MYHSIEVGIVPDFGWVLCELLVESIGDVVGWVSGDEQNTVPLLGQQSSQAAAGGDESGGDREKKGRIGLEEGGKSGKREMGIDESGGHRKKLVSKSGKSERGE